MRTLTHWITPHQFTGDIFDTIALVKARTPARWQPAVLVPAVYGAIWQASGELYNRLHMDLRPGNGPDLRWIVDRFEEAGIKCGAWGVPRELGAAEGAAHGEAASQVSLYVLDLEPYPYFLTQNDRDPDAFIANYVARAMIRPWISVVPQPSGIDPLRSAWRKWLWWAAGVRPQCYGATYPQLAWPAPSRAFLRAAMRRVRISRPVVPMLDSRSDLPRARSDRDLWHLGV